MRVRVIAKPKDVTELRHSGYWTDIIRGITSFECTQFPSVGTLCEVIKGTVMYNGLGLCEIGTKMYKLCFEEVGDNMKESIIVQGYIVSPDSDESHDAVGDILINDGTHFNKGLFEIVRNKITGKEGVKHYQDYKRCIGRDIDIIDNATIRIYYTDNKVTNEECENLVASIFDGKYYSDKNLVGYSEYTVTGYNIKLREIGGHNLQSEIMNHVGEYITFIMEW